MHFSTVFLEEFDFSLQKDILVKEPVRLQFRAEAYNLLNHPNFNIPNRTAFTPNFGSISSAQIRASCSSPSGYCFDCAGGAKEAGSGQLPSYGGQFGTG